MAWRCLIPLPVFFSTFKASSFKLRPNAVRERVAKTGAVWYGRAVLSDLALLCCKSTTLLSIHSIHTSIDFAYFGREHVSSVRRRQLARFLQGYSHPPPVGFTVIFFPVHLGVRFGSPPCIVLAHVSSHSGILLQVYFTEPRRGYARTFRYESQSRIVDSGHFRHPSLRYPAQACSRLTRG